MRPPRRALGRVRKNLPDTGFPHSRVQADIYCISPLPKVRTITLRVRAGLGGGQVGLGARESIPLSLLKTFLTSQAKPKEDTAKARLTKVCSFAAE